MVDIVNWAPVRRSSMSEFAVRPSRSVPRRGAAALASLDINQWRTLADSTVEPNAYYLADWELALDASARDRTNASVLTARDDIPSSECGAGALLGVIPVISAWRAYRIPLPVLVSADPYGTLCTPLLDHDLANDAAATLLRGARALGQARADPAQRRAGWRRHESLHSSARTRWHRPHTLQAHARACLDATRDADELLRDALGVKKLKELRRQRNRLAEHGDVSFQSRAHSWRCRASARNLPGAGSQWLEGAARNRIAAAQRRCSFHPPRGEGAGRARISVKS